MTVACPAPLDPAARRAREILAAAGRGWSLLPMRGKAPFHRGWSNLPPFDAEHLLEHARSENIGLRTGSASGVVVIDDDTPDQSAAETLNLPATVAVRTGSGRTHHYFRSPAARIGNSRGGLPAGIDVRGDGGVVVFVGSEHPDTGGIYEWMPGRAPDEIELAELPDHVLDLITKNGGRKKNDRKRSQKRESAHLRRFLEYASATCASVVAELAGAAEGERNETLNRGAFALGRLVGTGLLARERVEAALATAASESGLPEREIEATMRSGLDSGINEAYVLEELEVELDSRLLGLPPADEDPNDRPIVVFVDAERHRAIDAAMEVLGQQDPPIVFDQLGSLVCLVSIAAQAHRRGIDPERVVQVRELDPDYLSDLLGRLIRFRRRSEDGKLYPKDCPVAVARTILARSTHGKFAPLTGIIRTPTLRRDGTLLSVPGYDVATGLYLDIEPGLFDGVPDEPTLEQAQQALADLKAPFAEFDFVTEADQSVLLAAVLTPFVRWLLRTAPMFAISAPRRGSGKTLLARAVALIATGRSPWTVSQAQSEEEERKRWFAILLSNASIVNIDNVETPLGGATLCTLLTEDRLSDRVLQVSQVRSASTTNLTIIATGNNVEFVGDITRRVLLCSIDPGVEYPEDRTFEFNLDEFLLDNRARLVVAALTVLRAFVAAGRPKPAVRPFGSFEAWSDFVRGAMIWAGEPDPCDTRSRIEERDPRKEEAEALLVAWHERFGEREVTTQEVIAAATSTHGESVDEPSSLELALAPICGRDGGGLDTHALGRWLRTYRSRIEGGLRIEAPGRTHGRQRWRLRRA